MNLNKAQETIRLIQEEAKQKVAGIKSIKLQPTDDNATLKLLREYLNTAIAKIVSTTAARQYIGETTADLQDIATDIIKNTHTNETYDDPIIYPNNCKLFVQESNGGYLIIEESPQFRTIQGQDGETFHIPLPYVVFIIGFDVFTGKGYKAYLRTNLGVGFGRKPIASIDTELLVSNLPHTNGNNYICQPIITEEYSTVKELAEDTLNIFWNSAFHHEFMPFEIIKDNKKKEKIKSFADWQDVAPLDILKGNFSSGMSVRQLLKYFSELNKEIDNRVQQAVVELMQKVREKFSAKELSNLIHKTAEEIVDVSLQNALQHKN